MKLCICRDLSDKTFKAHLAKSGDIIACAEMALTQCCGSPTNCGQCIEMADDIVYSHNRRVETIRGLQSNIAPAKTREQA